MTQYHHPQPKCRAGFTLVELLITITIMVILATVALYTMLGVQQMAKIQRCKAQIARLHEIIAEKWETYEGRRYPPSGPPPSWWSGSNGWYQQLAMLDPSLSTRMNSGTAWQAFDRLWKIRENMRMDLPDRSTDIRWIRRNTYGYWNSDTGIAPTADANDYYRRTGGRALGSYAGAECLYMIISRARIGDSSALSFFGEKEIGDKDGDGLPEIWDPWGKPITFVRWPTGFSSPFQNVPAVGQFDREEFPADAFDVLDVDSAGYFHFSLIASAGPDGEFGFAVDKDMDVSPLDAPAQQIDFSQRNNGFPPDYPTTVFGPPSDPWRLGSPFPSEEAMDNVHNHLIETKTN